MYEQVNLGRLTQQWLGSVYQIPTASGYFNKHCHAVEQYHYFQTVQKVILSFKCNIDKYLLNMFKVIRYLEVQKCQRNNIQFFLKYNYMLTYLMGQKKPYTKKMRLYIVQFGI